MITQNQIDNATTDEIIMSLSGRSLIKVFKKLGININENIIIAVGKTKHCEGCPEEETCVDANKHVHNLKVINESMRHLPPETIRKCVLEVATDVVKNKYGVTKLPSK